MSNSVLSTRQAWPENLQRQIETSEREREREREREKTQATDTDKGTF